MSIDFGALNYLAIAVGAVGTFLIGGAWYTALFGKTYQKANRMSDEQMKALQAERPPAIFFGSMLVCYFLMAFGLAVLSQVTGISGAVNGVLLGVFIALVVAAVSWTQHIAANRDHAAYAIDMSYQAIYLIGVSALLGAWS